MTLIQLYIVQPLLQYQNLLKSQQLLEAETHQELIEKSGKHAELFALQARGYS